MICRVSFLLYYLDIANRQRLYLDLQFTKDLTEILYTYLVLMGSICLYCILCYKFAVMRKVKRKVKSSLCSIN
jgi:hypothetical protein